jgi:hypothetical protein
MEPVKHVEPRRLRMSSFLVIFISYPSKLHVCCDLRVQQASRPDYRAPSPTLAALPIALTLITLTLIVEGC